MGLEEPGGLVTRQQLKERQMLRLWRALMLQRM
jgi:hypothetical protein